jgi:antirestriction protein ArdC
MATNFNIYEELTNQMIEILESLKNDKSKWEKPWILAENGLGAHNAYSKHGYSGINQILLSYICSKRGYALNRWLTFKQISDLGGKVKKGERSTMVVFSKMLTFSKRNDGLGDSPEETPIEDNNEKLGVFRKFYLRYYNVFNVAQAEGLGNAFYEPYPLKEEKEVFEANVLGDTIINKSNADIIYIEGNEAFYRPGTDSIQLPLISQFRSPDMFYGVAFHELGHWTGHPNRLKRKLHNWFGTEDYAREELTAEMCAVFLCNHIGIERLMKHSGKYLNSWLKAIRDDKTAFVKATMQAQTAANYLLTLAGMQKENNQEETAAA